jgi:protein gp37
MTMAENSKFEPKSEKWAPVRVRDGVPVMSDADLTLPLRWRKPRRARLSDVVDLFHEAVPDAWIDRVFAVMALAPQHTFQVLTKRPERMREYMTGLRAQSPRVFAGTIARSMAVLGMHGDVTVDADYPHVWLGTSVEDQTTANERIPHLLATPAAVRFISAEPLLGPVDLSELEGGATAGAWLYSALTCDVDAEDDYWGGERLDWVICGGESGPGARPMDAAWAESLRDQCRIAGVAFFMKQMAKKAPIPADLMVREFPDAR